MATDDHFATQPPAHYNGRHHKAIWYAPNRFEAYGEAEIEAVTACLRDGWLAPGPRTREFERRVAAWFGKADGIFVNSGTSANVLSLHLCGLAPGDEVLTPACTFNTTVSPMLQLGLEVRFCDVELRRFVPSVAQCMAALTPATKAIVLPNLAGSKPDWGALRAALEAAGRREGAGKVWLVEDSADTMTRTPESDVSTVSFYASHVVTAGGCGGMVMFNDPAQRAVGLSYRDWGRVGTNTEDFSERFGHEVDGIEYDFKFLYAHLGYNFKCCEMNAAFGLVQMARLPELLARRRANVDRYRRNLEGTPLVLPDETAAHDPSPNWLALPLIVPPEWSRKELLQWIEQNGIQTRVFFAGNVCRHPAYAERFAAVKDDFPVSDALMRGCFMLGAHHGLTEADVDYVCEVLKEFRPGVLGAAE
jgi:CDP-6-deoxy-D-xylo-4-hexulose-3-dehydrase